MYIWYNKCFCHEELSGFPWLKFHSFFLLIEADETDDDDDSASEDEGM